MERDYRTAGGEIHQWHVEGRQGLSAVVVLSVVGEGQGRARRGWENSGGGGATSRHENREVEAEERLLSPFCPDFYVVVCNKPC